MKIFVTIGTYQPFDRLIEVVDKWFKNRNDIEGFAQIGGGTYLPQNIKYQRVLSEKEFNEKFDEADSILTEQLDALIELVRKTNTLFYDQYYSARVIKDLGTPQKTEEVKTPEPVK